MRKTLERYIAKNIFAATLLSALIITSVLLLIMLLSEAKNIGDGDYSLIEAFIYVLMRLPNEFYRFSPMLILLGTIVGMSILSTSRELSVMRASGMSVVRIIMNVLMTALLMVSITVAIGEWLAPDLSAKAEIRKENSRNGGQAVITSFGAWLHIDNNFIHIKRAVGRQMLHGVTRYEFDSQHRLLAAYYAKNMAYENKQWKMFDGVKTEFYENGAKSEHFVEADWDLKFNPNFLKFGRLDPFEMSLVKLAKYSAYLKQNHLQASEYQYEFWQRIMQPLAALIMVLLAIPFVFNTLKSALGWRIIIGIIVGFIFFMSNAFLGQLCVVYQLPASIAAALPILLFALIGLFLCKKLITN